ncbi:DUF6477 family protein [Pseudoroseicyclus sp. CXY001]|uniref:DUF6477 family protein n=1 Tax=Pseudoroseicyclus sp. CXY001 TaxID=3242492 RepID=UPI00358DD4A6
MQDILGMIGQLERPRLLVRAARAGVEQYRREQMLPRLLGALAPPRSGAAVLELLELEAEADVRRRAGTADYAVQRHVEHLIALMGEARLIRAAARRARWRAEGAAG